MKDGFSLADVIVSCGVLAVAVVLVCNLLPSAVLFLRGSEHRLEACRICDRVLEEARAETIAQLEAAPFRTVQEGPYRIERHTRILRPGRLAEIRCVVTWQHKSLEMVTYASKLSE